MKCLTDLKCGLLEASNKMLIESFFVHLFHLDIDFPIQDRVHRSREETLKILKLKDYIRDNYSDVQAIDYMPLLNRLRLYGNFKSIK